jgi:hypothetical protein
LRDKGQKDAFSRGIFRFGICGDYGDLFLAVLGGEIVAGI